MATQQEPEGERAKTLKEAKKNIYGDLQDYLFFAEPRSLRLLYMFTSCGLVGRSAVW